jgi:hypothetical protein
MYANICQVKFLYHNHKNYQKLKVFRVTIQKLFIKNTAQVSLGGAAQVMSSMSSLIA